jgi:hypothetical protein
MFGPGGILTVIGLLGLAACDSGDLLIESDLEELTIAVSQTVVTLDVGQTVTLEAVLVNEHAQEHHTRLAWQSSAPEVATIHLPSADETTPYDWWAGSDGTPLGGPEDPAAGEVVLVRALSAGTALLHIRPRDDIPGHFIAERHIRVWVREPDSSGPGA